MKKLLSIVLAVAMLFTMVLPMAVFAEDATEGEASAAISIANTAATTIDVDDYVVADNAAGFKASTQAKANGGDVLSGYKEGASTTTVASIDVTVANTGFYDLEYVATNYAYMSTPSNYSKVEFYLTPVVAEGDTATAEKVASTANQNVVEKYNFQSAYINYAKFCDIKYIAAGNYTLTVKVTAAGNVVRGGIDYIKFAASNVDVSATGATVELEKYNTHGYVTSLATASGGAYTATGGNKTKPVIQTYVTFAESDYYDIEYVAGEHTSVGTSHMSKITFYLDDTVLGTSAKSEGATFDGADAYGTNSPLVMKFNKSKVKIDAGRYLLNVDVATTTQDTTHKYKLDYIKFTPTAIEETIAADVATTIELSDYSTKDNVVKTEADGENKVIFTTWSTTRTEAYTIVEVAASGYYDIEYISNAPKANNYGAARFYLDDTEIASALKDTGVEATGYTLWTSTKVNKYTKGRVYIEAGRYVLKFEFTADGGTNYRGLADYIKFTPLEENEATTIAFDGETNNVVVTSAYVGSAKVIWVAYDANDKMTSHAISAAITLTNTGSQTVTVPGTFTAGTKMKAMLWVDETTCKPLTAFINK